MKMVLITAISVLGIAVIAVCGDNASVPWGYQSSSGVYGPSEWGRVNPTCDGTKQSPVDIVTNNVEDDSNLPKITLGAKWAEKLTESMVNATMSNNGHTVKVVFTKDGRSEDSPILTTQGTTIWRLVQFHLHWGTNDESGSEHLVNGKAFPAEIHFVHMNTKYNDFSAAVGNADGLMVMGFFFKEVANLSQELPLVKYLFDSLGHVMYEGDEKELNLTTFDLNSVITDSDVETFYHYSGSLTTPPCSESVTWNVMNPNVSLLVTKAQMTALRALKATKDGAANPKSISGNFRPVQALHGRKIKANFDQPIISHGRLITGSVLSIIAPIVLTVYKIIIV